MSTFWKAFLGGRVVAVIFILVCVTFGFGPDEFAKYMVSGLPNWISPEIAQVVFIVLGLLILVFFVHLVMYKMKPFFVFNVKTL